MKQTNFISGVNHVTLSVRNLDEAFEFYSKVLGFRPLAKRTNKSAYLLAGEDWIVLVQSLENSDNDRPLNRSYAHLAFSVDPNEFDRAAQMISDSGAEIWQKNTSPGDSIYFLDPSGNQLELHAGDWRTRLKWLYENQTDDVTIFSE